MIQTGLLSITFRQLSAERVIALTVEAGLDSIEWGGDIHVPHGDVARAQTVAKMTTDAGLFVSAYGSYYRLGEADSPDFESILDTAEALGTSHIRVWAGKRGSAEADAEYRSAVVNDAQRIVNLATARNMTISLEYHDNTLTDTLDSTLDLLNTVEQLRTYWQPPHTPDLDFKTHGLTTLLPWMTNVHVFHWEPATRARYPLSDGTSDWKSYIEIIRTSTQNHVLSLEFVKDDDEATFLDDARTFLQWLED